LEIERLNLLAAGTPQDFKAASDTIYNIGEWKIASPLLIIDVQIGLLEPAPPESRAVFCSSAIAGRELHRSDLDAPFHSDTIANAIHAKVGTVHATWGCGESLALIKRQCTRSPA